MITAHYNPADLDRVLKAYKKVAVMAVRAAKYEAPVRLARRFVADIIDAIGRQKYMSDYTPYGHSKGSLRYKKWKKAKGISPDKFWILYGDLLRNLKYWRKARGWFAGIPSGVKDSGGKSWRATRSGPKKEIVAYGWIMEEGLPISSGQLHPKRPIFEPVLDVFSETSAPYIVYFEIAPMIEREWS